MSQPTTSQRNLLKQLSWLLKALWIFLPGILILLVGYFALVRLPQGRDLIQTCTEIPRNGVFVVLAVTYWVFTTWYTARMVAYNRNDLYQQVPGILFHFPRLLAFLVFWVLWLSFYLLDENRYDHHCVVWLTLLVELNLYFLLSRWLNFNLISGGNLSQEKDRFFRQLRWVVRFAILLGMILVSVLWEKYARMVMLITLPLFQLGLFYLLVVRRTLDFKKQPQPNGSTAHLPANWFMRLRYRYLQWVYYDRVDPPEEGGSVLPTDSVDLTYERKIFDIYHLLTLVAVIVYVGAISSLWFSRALSGFPFAILAFGILLGISNFLALLSRRSQINIHFLLILAIIIGGKVLPDPHKVKLITAENQYDLRPTLVDYTDQWLGRHREVIDTLGEHETYPAFIVLANGGASRSGYWVARVLNELHKDEQLKNEMPSRFQEHLFCLSGSSGGSVGTAAFVAQLIAERENPALRMQVENNNGLSVQFLRTDFLSYPLTRLLGWDLISSLLPFLPDRAVALELGLEIPTCDPDSHVNIIGDIMTWDIARLIPDSANELPILFLNTTRVQDASPAVVSTLHVDSSNAFGQRTDLLTNVLRKDQQMRLSTAAILSSRFPYVSPAGNINNQYFVDGGYFDNSGAGIVHEMLLALHRMTADTTNDESRERGRRLKKVEFIVIQIANSPERKEEWKKMAPVINDLAVPMITLAGSYSTQTAVNDQRLKQYIREMTGHDGGFVTLNLYQEQKRLGKDDSFPMSWVISRKRLHAMDSLAHDMPLVKALKDRIKR